MGSAGRVRRSCPVRPRRPIELIARDAQRLGLGFRHVQEGGVSFAQFEGRRRAYDLVLAEACASLSVEHLLAVLPPASSSTPSDGGSSGCSSTSVSGWTTRPDRRTGQSARTGSQTA